MTSWMLLIMMSFIYMKNSPVSTIISLIMMILIMSLKILFFLLSSWIPLIIFLSLISGLMILFIYMASISPNKKSSKIKKKKWIKIILLLSTINMIITNKFYLPASSPPMLIHHSCENTPLMVFSVSYLFLFLILLTFMLKKTSGPLRIS